MLGLDGDGPEAFENVFQFVEQSGLYDVQITYLTPFPGTPLWQRLSEEGRLLAIDALERCSLFDINFQPNRMSVHELREGFHALTAKLYQPSFVAARTRRFRQQRRQLSNNPAL